MIDLFKVHMAPEAAANVSEVLNSGYIGEGPKVKLFEEKLKTLFNNDNVVTVNSATSAEHLILHLLKKPAVFRDISDNYLGITTEIHWPGINPGDEILATPLTCTASNWPILANGLNIKWVDIDPHTMNMDLDDLARKLTPTTKAIMLVYWGGTPVNISKLKSIIARAKDVIGFTPMVIQDCAHGIGTTYNNQHIASQGFISTFSFQAIKHLTCGDGGALVLPYSNLAERARLVRWYGINREGARKDFRCEHNIEEWGFKFHMNDISATIGLSNLPYLPSIIDRHRKNALHYTSSLANVNGLKLLPHDTQSSYWIYTVLVEDRDSFMRSMAANKIQVSRVHERNDKHSCVSKYLSYLPSLEKVIDKMICLPVGWHVTEEQVDFVISKIKQGWQ